MAQIPGPAPHLFLHPAGAHPLTMGGLAGMGDLVLTCTGDLSRNRTVGLRIGRGEKLADITASMKAVAEGVLTSRCISGSEALRSRSAA